MSLAAKKNVSHIVEPEDESKPDDDQVVGVVPKDVPKDLDCGVNLENGKCVAGGTYMKGLCQTHQGKCTIRHARDITKFRPILEKELAQLLRDHETVQHDNKVLQDEIDKYQDMAELYHQGLQQNEAEYGQKLADMKNRLEVENEEILKSDRVRLIQELQDQYANNLAELSTIQEELHNLNAQKDQLMKNIKDRSEVMRQQDDSIENNRAALQQLESDIARLQQIHTTLQNRVEESSHTLQQLANERSELQREIGTNKNSLLSLQQELSSKQRELQTLRQEYNGLVEEFESKKTALDNQIEKLNIDVEKKYTAQTNELEIQLDAKRAELAELNKQLRENVAKQQAALTNLTALKEFAQKNEDDRKQLDKMRQALELREQELQKTLLQEQQAEKEIETLSAQIVAMQGIVQNAEKCETEKAQLQLQIVQVQQEIAKQKDELARLNSEIKFPSSSSPEFSSPQFFQHDSLIEQLQRGKAAQEELVKHLQTQLEDLQNKIKDSEAPKQIFQESALGQSSTPPQLPQPPQSPQSSVQSHQLPQNVTLAPQVAQNLVTVPQPKPFESDLYYRLSSYLVGPPSSLNMSTSSHWITVSKVLPMLGLLLGPVIYLAVMDRWTAFVNLFGDTPKEEENKWSDQDWMYFIISAVAGFVVGFFVGVLLYRSLISGAN